MDTLEFKKFIFSHYKKKWMSLNNSNKHIDEYMELVTKILHTWTPPANLTGLQEAFLMNLLHDYEKAMRTRAS